MTFATYPSLKDQVVLITGGGSGIGAAFVETFHAQGGRVGFLDLHDGDDLAGRLGVWFEPCDVTDTPAFTSAWAHAAQAMRPISILINNVATDNRRAAVDTGIEAWRQGLAVNLDAAFVGATSVYPGMKAAGAAAIHDISSINAMTKSLAREWEPDNVRVNAISPGWVITERQLKLWLKPQAEAEWRTHVALKSRIYPADVARLALFLASAEAAMITSQNFVIDGGRT